MRRVAPAAKLTAEPLVMTSTETGETESLAAAADRWVDRGLHRQVATLAWPVFIEQVLLYLVGFSDTLLTGRYLAVRHLAAVTVSSYLMWFVGSLLIVASAGGTTLVSRSMGAGDLPAARRFTRRVVVLGLLVGTLLLAVGYPLAPAVVAWLRLDPSARGPAAEYIRILLLAMPLQGVLSGGVACLRGAGDTRTGMWIMILVNVLNVALSWLLVAGALGIASWGLAGIATGTAIATAVGGLVMLALLARGRSGLHLAAWAASRRDARTEYYRLLRISVPAAAESGANSLCQLAFLALINRLGEVATAAHGVAIRCEAIAFLTIAAFAVAASTLTGQLLGAHQPARAVRAIRAAWLQGVVLLVLLGAVMFVGADAMFRLFLGSGRPEVAAQGAPVLRLVAFAMPLLATINVLGAALRGAGDTLPPMGIVLLGYLVVRLPLTVWLVTPAAAGGLEQGLHGAWIAMVVDLAVRAALLVLCFHSGRWQRVRV